MDESMADSKETLEVVLSILSSVVSLGSALRKEKEEEVLSALAAPLAIIGRIDPDAEVHTNDDRNLSYSTYSTLKSARLII